LILTGTFVVKYIEVGVVFQGRQLHEAFFLRKWGFFVFKNSWLLKDIFREIEAFVKISILFQGIFREIEDSFGVM
jgi:hypothetical protein